MKKRILFLIPNLAHGGAERVLVNLVNNLDRERYAITLQTLFDVGVNRQYLRPEITYIGGFKRYFKGNSLILKLFSPKILYRFFVRKDYDIVISYLEGPTARIISGCSNPEVRKICWVHIEFNNEEMAKVGFRSVAEASRCYNQFDEIVAVSRNVKECFVSALDVLRPVRVLYNTNETERIIALSKQPISDLQFSFGDPQTPSVCSVAKLMETKGYDRLLKVHHRLLKEGLLHKIYILGMGEEEKNLRRLIEEYGVAESFVLLGFRENPYQYVANCDLYVCSSRREGFSTAVTEALILGVPVVSTACSGAKELLGEQDEHGIVVENSEEGIYTGMKRMLSDKRLLESYRHKAALRGKRFSKSLTVSAVEDMLDNG